MDKIFSITIDGPAGAGKSTIAKLIAKKLHINYIDTGAMYRAITWKALTENIDLKNKDKIIEMCRRIKIEYENGKVFIDGIDTSKYIRDEKITENTSFVAAIEEVRTYLRKFQRKLSKEKSIVMEGRDIGSVVLPDAKYKFYLDATVEERAKRRYLELKQKGIKVDFEKVKRSIIERDKKDTSRGLCPLIVPEGAYIIDSTDKTIEEVAEEIIRVVRNKGERLK